LRTFRTKTFRNNTIFFKKLYLLSPLGGVPWLSLKVPYGRKQAGCETRPKRQTSTYLTSAYKLDEKRKKDLQHLFLIWNMLPDYDD